MAQRHHRLYLRPWCPVCLDHRHHDLIPWHPHRAEESSPNNPATRQNRLFQDLTCQCQSPHTCPPAFPISQSSFCSRRPGIFPQVIPRRRPPSRPVNIKLRKPSHGQPLQQNSAARSSTRRLAQSVLLVLGGNVCTTVFVTLTLTDAVLPPFSSLLSGFPQIPTLWLRTPLALHLRPPSTRLALAQGYQHSNIPSSDLSPPKPHLPPTMPRRN